MSDGMTQAVLKSLKENKGGESKGSPSKFDRAAKQMFDAAKGDDGEAFAKAFKNAVRIFNAENQ